MADIKRLRHRLADELTEHSHEDVWQEAFRLAGEGAADAPYVPEPLEGTPPPRSRAPPPRSRGDSSPRAPEKVDSRKELLDKAITWKLGVKRPPAHLLKMALDALAPGEQEDLLEEHKAVVSSLEGGLRKKLVSKSHESSSLQSSSRGRRRHCP